MNEDFPVDDSLLEPSFGKAQRNKLNDCVNICLKCNNSIAVKQAIEIGKHKSKSYVVENTTCYCTRNVLRKFIVSTDDRPIVECQLFEEKKEEKKRIPPSVRDDLTESL